MLGSVTNTVLFFSLSASVLGAAVHPKGSAPRLPPRPVSRTIVKRADPSSYPWASADDPEIENEFKWLGWDPNNEQDKTDGTRLHAAFKEWIDLAKAGQPVAADSNNAIYKRWFGTQTNPNEPGDVFKNMIDVSTGKVNPIVATMVNRRDDYHNDETQRCSAKPKLAAYTTPGTGEFHVCAYGLQRKMVSEISCDSLGDTVSAAMRSVALTLLHEMTHYDKIGSDATNEGIVDHAGGSYRCFALDDEDKLSNAQNYAWLAADAYFSTKCSKTFNDPEVGTAGTDEDEDYATPPSNPPPPPSGPTKTLQIITDFIANPQTIEDWEKVDWQYFQTPYGVGVDCRTDYAFHEERSVDWTKTPTAFPDGTFQLRLFDQDVTYFNGGSDPGKITVDGVDHACRDDPADKDPSDPKADKGNFPCGDKIRQPVFLCDW